MSNLMIRNGYNGSHRRYRERISKETRQEGFCDFKRSLHFPAIIHQDKHTTRRQVKTKSLQNRSLVVSPDDNDDGCGYFSYSPSLTRDDTNDCIILFPDEISELRHLAVTLGIDTQRESHHDRLAPGMNSRWSPVKESKGDQWWKNSKKWIKHTDEDVQSGHMYDAERKWNLNVKRTKRKETKKNEKWECSEMSNKGDLHDGLPENIKKSTRSVVIPGVGCSYRLPVINKK